MEQWLKDGLADFGLFTVYGLAAGSVGGWLSQYIFPSLLQDKKYKLEEKAETHKLNLKRKELMFQRELEAADAYLSLHRKLWPQYKMPNMEWYDACVDVAPKLANYEKQLEEYLEKHSVGLTEDTRKKIESAKFDAASEKFEIEDGPDFIPSYESRKMAGQVLKSLEAARLQILNDLKGSVPTSKKKSEEVSA